MFSKLKKIAEGLIMAFTSLHTNDNSKSKIDIEIIESKEELASEFKGFPILMTIDGLNVYLRKLEAERIFILLGAALREIDKAEINEALDPKRFGDS
jgi:hypothetical protein